MILDTFWKHKKVLLFFFLLAACLFSRAIAAEETPTTLTNCDIQLGPCTKSREGLAVTLDIFPKPVRAMKELTFRLTLTGREFSGNPHIDLGMPGMAMGPNRVLMKRVEDNTSRVEDNTSRVEDNTSRVEDNTSRVENNTSRVENNTYEGQGVIVKCPSGRRTWKATVSLPDAGVMDFIFDVLY